MCNENILCIMFIFDLYKKKKKKTYCTSMCDVPLKLKLYYIIIFTIKKYEISFIFNIIFKLFYNYHLMSIFYFLLINLSLKEILYYIVKYI